jgi:hypothetical protein
LSHADVGIGQHCLGGLDVVLRKFRRPASMWRPRADLIARRTSLRPFSCFNPQRARLRLSTFLGWGAGL